MHAVLGQRSARLSALGASCVVAAGIIAGSAPARSTLLAPTTSPGATGRVEGTVIISRAVVARRPVFRIYADATPGSQPPDRARPDSITELANVVIYLEGDGLTDPTTAGGSERRTMEQRDEQFVPHVLPVTRGTRVAFPNADDIYHNVFSLSKAAAFDLGRYPTGQSRERQFNTPGTVQVFCHIHSDMAATVLVLANRFFAVPTANGRFAIDSIPAGDYSIVGWHERVKPSPRRIHVGTGETTRVDFNIPVPPAPGKQ